MSDNKDFLQDFFKEQNLFQKKENVSSTQEKKENIVKTDDEKEACDKKTSIVKTSQSKQFLSAKEINLKALFEGIEKEEQEFIEQFHKESEELKKEEIKKREEELMREKQKEEELQKKQKELENIKEKEKKNNEEIYNALQAQNKRLQIQLIKKNIQSVQNTYKQKFIYIISQSEFFKQPQKIEHVYSASPYERDSKKLYTLSTEQQTNKKVVKNVIEKKREQDNINKNISFKKFNEIKNIKPKKRVNSEEKINNKINQKDFVIQTQKSVQKKNIIKKEISPVSSFIITNQSEQKKVENKKVIQPTSFIVKNNKTLIQQNIQQNPQKGDVLRKNNENIENIKSEIIRNNKQRNNNEVKNPFIISRKGKKYLPDIWEKSPDRIPVFEVSKIEKKSIQPEKTVQKLISKEFKNPLENVSFEKINNTVEKISTFGKYAQKKIQNKSNKVFKKVSQALETGIEKSEKIREKHIESFQKEMMLYQDMIETSGKNIKQQISQIQKKSKQHFEKFQENQIKRKKEKLEKEKIQEIKRIEREKEVIDNKKIEKKQSEQKKNISTFSTKKGILVKNILDKKALIKEWVQIGGMVASVFIIGIVGLRLPGFMSQYESVWNADFFAEQQQSVSFLLNDTVNPFENIKSLPVAGNISHNNDTIDTNVFLNITPPDTRIVIPKIAKNIPILEIGDDSRLSENWEKLEADIQDALQDGVVHYPGTAIPGDNGNVFITGHSSYYPWDPGRYKDVFAALHNLEVGDEYYIFDKGKKYKYIITTRKIVPPSDVSVLDQDASKKISTLMTCTPVGTAKNRLILQAEQVSVEY